jgi:hypothetical protein
MRFWDIAKTAVIVEGINHMMKSGKKNTRSGYDPGAWRRNIDKDNDSYRDLFCDEDSF